MFSGVKLSMGSFILFLALTFWSDTLAIIKHNVRTHEIYQRIPVMVEDGLQWVEPTWRPETAWEQPL